MTLARVLANAGVVKNRLLTEARLSTDPYIIVARTEEAAALEHLMAIARPLLRPTPSPDLAEAMVDHAARLGTAGVYDIRWAGLQWRIPLCQYHADEQAAGAPVLELDDFSRLRSIGRCWDDERALGLLVCWCPAHGIHRETLARLEQMAGPQIFPQDEED